MDIFFEYNDNNEIINAIAILNESHQAELINQSSINNNVCCLSEFSDGIDSLIDNELHVYKYEYNETTELPELKDLLTILRSLYKEKALAESYSKRSELIPDINITYLNIATVVDGTENSYETEYGYSLADVLATITAFLSKYKDICDVIDTKTKSSEMQTAIDSAAWPKDIVSAT